jgi:hypothetical protein
MKLTIALDLLLSMLSHAGEISALIQKAKASGSDEISEEDWQAITDADDAARTKLELAIAAAS